MIVEHDMTLSRILPENYRDSISYRQHCFCCIFMNNLICSDCTITSKKLYMNLIQRDSASFFDIILASSCLTSSHFLHTSYSCSQLFNQILLFSFLFFCLLFSKLC